MPTFEEIFTPLITAITVAFGWFESLGVWSDIIIAMVVIFLFSRLILAPLFGASPNHRLKNSGSDSVKRRTDEN